MKAFSKTLILLIGFILIATVFAEDGLPENLSPIYDAETTIPLMRFGHGWANDIVWSPDGTKLAVATSIGLWLYDASNLQAEPVLVNETVFDARALEYSPDGRFLAAGGSGLYLWDATTRELVRSFETGDILDLAFSPDSSQLLSSHTFASETKGVDVWEIETGEKLTTLSQYVFAELAFSPDGRYLSAILLGDCCFTNYLWETSTWNILFSGDIETQEADDDRVVFSPDSQTLVMIDRTGSFTALEPQSLGFIATVVLETEVEDYFPTEAAFSPDGRLFITLSRLGILRIWETKTYASPTIIDLGWNPSVAQLSPDGTQIAAINTVGSLRIWDVATGDLVAQRDNFAIDDPVIAFSPDGSLLASGATSGEIWLWDVATGAPLFMLSGHEGQILSLDFSSDGLFLVSTSRDGTVRLWDMAERDLSRIVASTEQVLISALFNAENQILVAERNRIQAYDLTTNEAVEWLYDAETESYLSQFETEQEITTVASEGGRFAVATRDGQIRLWDNRMNENWDVTRGLGLRRINTMSFYYAEDLLYAGDDNVVLQWNSLANRIIGTHSSWIYALAANEYVLVSAGCGETKRSPWDGYPYCDGAEMRVWDFMKGRQGIVSQEQGHTGTIQDMAFNPAGSLLATASDDGTILLWGNPAPEN